jgi:hypothetical protein
MLIDSASHIDTFLKLAEGLILSLLPAVREQLESNRRQCFMDGSDSYHESWQRTRARKKMSLERLAVKLTAPCERNSLETVRKPGVRPSRFAAKSSPPSRPLGSL